MSLLLHSRCRMSRDKLNPWLHSFVMGLLLCAGFPSSSAVAASSSPYLLAGSQERGVTMAQLRDHDKRPDLGDLMMQASAYFAKADYPAAIAVWSRVIASTQSGPLLNEALVGRAKAYLIVSQPGLALADIDKCKYDPRQPEKVGEQLLLRGIAQLQLKQYQTAVQSLIQAERLLPNNAILLSNRAVAYQSMGQVALARQDLQKSLRIQPVVSTYYNLAVLEKDSGNYAGCYSLLSQIIAQRPAYSQVYVQRGICAALQGRHDESIADMLKVLKMEPSNVDALEQIGISLAAKAQYDAARKYLEMASSIRLAAGQVEQYQKILSIMAGFDRR